MNSREKGSIHESRWLDLRQGCEYTSLGKASFRKFAKEAGAVIKIGRIARYDKNVIDRAMDEARQATVAE